MAWQAVLHERGWAAPAWPVWWQEVCRLSAALMARMPDEARAAAVS